MGFFPVLAISKRNGVFLFYWEISITYLKFIVKEAGENIIFNMGLLKFKIQISAVEEIWTHW